MQKWGGIQGAAGQVWPEQVSGGGAVGEGWMEWGLGGDDEVWASFSECDGKPFGGF